MSHIVTTTRGSAMHALPDTLAPGMSRRRGTDKPAYRRELWQYRSLLAFAVVCFFLFACVARLLRRCLHPLAARAPESAFAEARRLAYTAVPHAFMR
jgi:hypothetical protein